MFTVTCSNKAAIVYGDRQCDAWKSLGYCTDSSHGYVQYMQENCLKSCGLCGKQGKKLLSAYKLFKLNAKNNIVKY